MTNEEKIAALERQLLESRAREARLAKIVHLYWLMARQVGICEQLSPDCGCMPYAEAADCAMREAREVTANALRWLEAREKRAAAKELEAAGGRWVEGDEYGAEGDEILRCTKDRAAALRAEADALEAGEVSGA